MSTFDKLKQIQESEGDQNVQNDEILAFSQAGTPLKTTDFDLYNQNRIIYKKHHNNLMPDINAMFEGSVADENSARCDTSLSKQVSYKHTPDRLGIKGSFAGIQSQPNDTSNNQSQIKINRDLSLHLEDFTYSLVDQQSNQNQPSQQNLIVLHNLDFADKSRHTTQNSNNFEDLGNTTFSMDQNNINISSAPQFQQPTFNYENSYYKQQEQKLSEELIQVQSEELKNLIEQQYSKINQSQTQDFQQKNSQQQKSQVTQLTEAKLNQNNHQNQKIQPILTNNLNQSRRDSRSSKRTSDQFLMRMKQDIKFRKKKEDYGEQLFNLTGKIRQENQVKQLNINRSNSKIHERLYRQAQDKRQVQEFAIQAELNRKNMAIQNERKILKQQLDESIELSHTIYQLDGTERKRLEQKRILNLVNQSIESLESEYDQISQRPKTGNHSRFNSINKSRLFTSNKKISRPTSALDKQNEKENNQTDRNIPIVKSVYDPNSKQKIGVKQQNEVTKPKQAVLNTSSAIQPRQQSQQKQTSITRPSSAQKPQTISLQTKRKTRNIIFGDFNSLDNNNQSQSSTNVIQNEFKSQQVATPQVQKVNIPKFPTNKQQQTQKKQQQVNKGTQLKNTHQIIAHRTQFLTTPNFEEYFHD
eukprot:403337732